MSPDAKSPFAFPWHEFFGNWNPFRWITVVILLAGGLSAWEYSHSGKNDVDLAPGPKLNYADTVAAIFPDSDAAIFQKAKQAGECFVRFRDRKDIPDACRQYYGQDMHKVVRDYYRKGLDLGLKNEEELYYEYLHFLITTRASESEIQAAYDAWIRAFPLSRQRDPKTGKPRTK